MAPVFWCKRVNTMAEGKTRLCIAAAIVVAVSGGAWAGDEKAQERPDSDSRSEEKTAGENKEARPTYVPRLAGRGAPRARVGGGTRGAAVHLPKLLALEPAHVGATVREQPTLYWFIAEATDLRVDFSLVDSESLDSVLEFTLKQPVAAGIQAIQLAEYDVRLELGRTYQWYVALVPDPERRSNDLVTGGAIQRVAPSRRLEEALARAPLDEAPTLYAREGIWYEALSSLSERIARDPSNAILREHRAALLDEVGLRDAAAFDRALEGPES